MSAGLLPYYAALLTGIALGAAGQLLLKTGAVRGADGLATQFFSPFTVAGLAAYGFAALLYIVAIRRIPLSHAYPTVALSYAAVAIAAHYLWDERIGGMQIAGMTLIFVGIMLLHRG